MSLTESPIPNRITGLPLNQKYPAQDHVSSSSNESDDDDENFMEKDEVELRLEKSVFGDELGFHQGLKSHKNNVISQAFENVEEIEVDGYESEEQDDKIHDIDDADVNARIPSKLFQVSWLIASAVFPRLQPSCSANFRSPSHTKH